MPRENIEVPTGVERIDILDEDGELDQETMPDLDIDTLVDFHRWMLLSRRFDERLLELQRQGQIGTFAPVRGQEAAQIGAVAALEEDDWLVPAFRETAVHLWRGIPMSSIIVFYAGYNEGGRIPEDQRDLPITIPVATQLPHAAGVGYSIKLREDDAVVMTFFGDGATSEGDFHESLNFAGLFGLPIIFVCQNNQWAISTPREKQTRSETLAQKGLAYGIPGVQVDGNDALAVHLAAREAVERARAGEGPTLIECVTYRMSVHTTADDPSKYRDESEVEKWEKRDPISRLRKYLSGQGALDDSAVEELEEEIAQEIQAAWEQAQERMAELDDPAAMFDHLYAELPDYLREQRERFIDRNDGEAEGDENG